MSPGLAIPQNVELGQGDHAREAASYGGHSYRQPRHVEAPSTRRNHQTSRCYQLLREERAADCLQHCRLAGYVVSSAASQVQAGRANVAQAIPTVPRMGMVSRPAPPLHPDWHGMSAAHSAERRALRYPVDGYPAKIAGTRSVSGRTHARGKVQHTSAIFTNTIHCGLGGK